MKSKRIGVFGAVGIILLTYFLLFLLISGIIYFGIIYKKPNDKYVEFKNQQVFQNELSYSYMDDLKFKRSEPTVLRLNNNDLAFIGHSKESAIEIYDSKRKEMRPIEDKPPVDIYRNKSFKLSNGNILIFSNEGIVEFDVKTAKFILKKKLRMSALLPVLKIDDDKFFLITHLNSTSLKEQEFFLKIDSLYSYHNNDLKYLRQIKVPINKNIFGSDWFPYSTRLNKTLDNKVLIMYTRDLNKNENHNRIIYDFMELFDPKSLTFTPIDYYNYNIKFPETGFVSENILYNSTTNTYSNLYQLIEDLKKSSFSSDFKYISMGNDIIFILPVFDIWHGKPLEYLLVYKYNTQNKRAEPIGYLPFHVTGFALFALNENDILISGGYTYDGSDEYKIINIKHNNIILHLK